MRLKPRYSLLTLLVLTALVAGGVKMWYGPHHVVERRTTYTEDEYTYTRDLFGRKTRRGVGIMHYEQPTGSPGPVMLLYYRQGLNLYRRSYIHLDATAKKYSPVVFDGDETKEFTRQELEELNHAIEREYVRLQALGYTLSKNKITVLW